MLIVVQYPVLMVIPLTRNENISATSPKPKQQKKILMRENVRKFFGLNDGATVAG